MDNTNKDNRIIILHDDVDKASIRDTISDLLGIIAEDDESDRIEREYQRDPIHLYINTHGGEVDDMWALIDIIKMSKTPIYTYCTGYAYSAGFLIFLAGKKRFGSLHSTYMFHQLSSGVIGTYKDIAEYTEYLNNCNELILNYVVSNTKIPRDKLLDVCERKLNWYITADEALSLGVVTDTIPVYKPILK